MYMTKQEVEQKFKALQTENDHKHLLSKVIDKETVEILVIKFMRARSYLIKAVDNNQYQITEKVIRVTDALKMKEAWGK